MRQWEATINIEDGFIITVTDRKGDEVGRFEGNRILQPGDFAHIAGVFATLAGELSEGN